MPTPTLTSLIQALEELPNDKAIVIELLNKPSNMKYVHKLKEQLYGSVEISCLIEESYLKVYIVKLIQMERGGENKVK